MQKSLTIYLHYISTISQEISKKRKVKTVTLEDLKKALIEVGF